MSQYFEHAIKLSDNDSAKAMNMHWSDTESIVGISNSEGGLGFFQGEGTKITCPFARSGHVCTSFGWKPNEKICVAGWDDGCISYWNSKEGGPIDHTGIHRTNVTMLEWSPDGELFISCDSRGGLAVWRPAQRGRLSKPIYHNTDNRIMKHVAFANPTEISTGKESGILHTFFLAGQNNSLYMCDDMKQCIFLKNFKSEIDQLLFYNEKSRLIILCNDQSLIQFLYCDDGSLQPCTKVKLNIMGSKGILKADWIAPGLLATVSGDYSIKFWDLMYDSNYSLTTSSFASKDAGVTIKVVSSKSRDQNNSDSKEEDKKLNSTTTVTRSNFGIQKRDELYTFAFDKNRRILCATGKQGTIYFWKYIYKSNSNADSNNDRVQSLEVHWKPLDIFPNNDLDNSNGDVRGPKQLGTYMSWGPGNGCVVVNFNGHPYMYSENTLKRRLRDNVAAVQISATEILIDDGEKSGSYLYTNPFTIYGIDISKNIILFHNDNTINIIEVDTKEHTTKQKGTFTRPSIRSIGIYDDNIYIGCDRGIEIVNTSGVNKGEIGFMEGEGIPTHISINNNFMAVCTSGRILRIYDIKRKDPKLITNGGKIVIHTEEGEINPIIRSISVNSDGKRVSILANKHVSGSMIAPDPMIYIFNSELDSILSYKCENDFIPMYHYWDNNESTLLCIQCNKEDDSLDIKANIPSVFAQEDENENENVIISTLFCSSEYGVKLADTIHQSKQVNCLLGINAPNLYFACKIDIQLIKTKLMRDFVGFQEGELDDKMKRALLDFSYNLTIGNMDAAYASVKNISNTNIWENMALMCIKTMRLDVAQVCLSQMGHGRGAHAVRNCLIDETNSKEVVVAMLAIQLGHLDEAKQLYESCGRYDLLNDLYQAAGQWTKALEIARDKDRVHLRTTHFQYAKHLESILNYKKAIEHYESANVSVTEVPRMLYDKENMGELQAYIQQSKDLRLLKWWGQYCESKGDFTSALTYYKNSEDILSQVRILCSMKNYDAACELVRTTGDQAGSYHLARQFESQGEIQKAITYYISAKKYGHAVTLAKDSGLDNDLLNLALMSSKKRQVEVANYFENKGEMEKAVKLYHKAGQIHKAMDLCKKGQLYDLMGEVTEDLSEASPEMLLKCTQYFIDNGQVDKAIELYAASGKYETALEMIEKNNIKVTPEIVEKMSIPKSEDAAAEKRRATLLVKLADICQNQGMFKEATKIYAKAGYKKEAINCLIRSGDTEKIIFFANVSKNREVYLLAGNYLQGLTEKNDPTMMTTIVSFYTKAKAYRQLSNFYQSYAQSQIDEYRDYLKAQQALLKAQQALDKGSTDKNDESYITLLNKMKYVEGYCEAQNMLATDQAQGLTMCLALLKMPDIEIIVRIGDVYTLIIETYVDKKMYKEGLYYLQEMQNKQINIREYVDESLIYEVYNALGIASDEKEDDTIPDDIADD